MCQVAGKKVNKVCNKSSKEVGTKVYQGTRQEIMNKIARNQAKNMQEMQQKTRERNEKSSMELRKKYAGKVPKKQVNECSGKLARNQAKTMPVKQQESTQKCNQKSREKLGKKKHKNQLRNMQGIRWKSSKELVKKECKQTSN